MNKYVQKVYKSKEEKENKKSTDWGDIKEIDIKITTIVNI